MKLPRFDRPRTQAPAPQPDRNAAEDARRLERKNDLSLGVRHEHNWLQVDTLPRLQSAHDAMRWDVSKSRIMSVSHCTICSEYQRESIDDCSVIECQTHKICQRPYR